jgi:hypothetical protein
LVVREASEELEMVVMLEITRVKEELLILVAVVEVALTLPQVVELVVQV